MLTLTYRDRSTGEAVSSGTISASVPLRALFEYWEALGWDIEIVGYSPA